MKQDREGMIAAQTGDLLLYRMLGHSRSCRPILSVFSQLLHAAQPE